MKKILLSILFLATWIGNAQITKEEQTKLIVHIVDSINKANATKVDKSTTIVNVENKSPEKKSKLYKMSSKGIGFTAADSTFQLNLGVRIQSRAGFIKVEHEEGVVEGEVRRMRLKFNGFVVDPKFSYKIELGFSAGDLGVIKAGQNENVILDAVFFYKPTKNWTIAFGQAKLPGNNQRVISSGALEFTDRTINNAEFNIDRDFGFFLDYKTHHADRFSYSLMGALTKGEGRNWTITEHDGISLTGKAELFPLGTFTNNGSLFEADLEREKSLKWMISGAYSQNNGAIRTRGQLGSLLFTPRTLRSVFFDTMLKFNGWAAEGSYMSRNNDDPITYDPKNSDITRAVVAGHGFDTQLSYLFPSNMGISGRYSKVYSDEAVKRYYPDVQETALGLSKYFLQHKLKIQAECSYQQTQNYLGENTNSWYARFQVEIGI